jgi:hypothetical protein
LDALRDDESGSGDGIDATRAEYVEFLVAWGATLGHDPEHLLDHVSFGRLELMVLTDQHKGVRLG